MDRRTRCAKEANLLVAKSRASAVSAKISWMARFRAARRWGLGALFVGMAGASGSVVAQTAARTLSPTELAQDIAVFRNGFFDLDRAYSARTRADAERRLSALEKAGVPISTVAFTIAICQIAALADNGHSMCFYPRSQRKTLTFGSIDGEFYVVAAAPEHLELLGARLIAIDGRATRSIAPVLRTLFGGVTARRDARAADVLSRPMYLNALGLTTDTAAATYRLRTPSGRVLERTLSPLPVGPNWVQLPPADHTPWALQDPHQPFRWRDAPALDAVVVQMRSNLDTENQKIADFLNDAEANRARLGRKNVVLDMRGNDGGDFLLSRDFMLSWPSRVPPAGRFFILIGPSTFSAGMADVAYLKQVGGDRVILVGAAPGDRLTFFAEGHLAHLPNSGVEVLPATQRDDLRTGCRGYSDCYAALAQPGAPTGTPAEEAIYVDKNFGRKPLEVRSLDPDLRAPWTIADYLAGRDPAMAAVAAYLQSHRP